MRATRIASKTNVISGRLENRKSDCPPTGPWVTNLRDLVVVACTVALASVLAPGPRAASAHGPLPASQCVDPAELGSHWPPRGAVAAQELLGKGALRPIQLDVIPFKSVQVLGVVCGDVRGRGQEAYATFELPPPSPFLRSVLLTALHRDEGALVAIDAEGPDNPYDGLWLLDVTGDGRPEIVFAAGTGAFTAARFGIWGWEDEGYRKQFGGGSDYPPGFEDLDGDGVPEMILGQFALQFAPRVAGLVWPTTYRWDGVRFRGALFPELYAGFLALGLRVLDLKTISHTKSTTSAPSSATSTKMQGRAPEARAQYQRAYDAYAARSTPRPCAGAAEAVREYYRSIPEDLARAYSMLSEAARQQRPYPDYAAGFSRTREVHLLEEPRVAGQEGDVSLVAVRLMSSDLTPEGEIEERFAGTWRVLHTDRSCILEGAEITRLRLPAEGRPDAN